jgi:hypothetical protein
MVMFQKLKTFANFGFGCGTNHIAEDDNENPSGSGRRGQTWPFTGLGCCSNGTGYPILPYLTAKFGTRLARFGQSWHYCTSCTLQVVNTKGETSGDGYVTQLTPEFTPT